jgi:hypothetical protein
VQERGVVVVRKEAKAKRTLRMSGQGSGSSSALMVEIVELL